MRVFWFITLMFSLVALFISANPPKFEFHSFDKLTWANTQECSLNATIDNNNSKRTCKTVIMSIPSRYFELELKNTTHAIATITVHNSQHLTYTLPTTSKDNPREYLRVELPELPLTETPVFITITLSDEADTGTASVRKRINYFEPGKWHDIRSSLSSLKSRIAIALIVSFCLVGFLRVVSPKVRSTLLVLCYLATITFFFHWSTSVFFWWDDWHVIDRFFTEGYPGALISHNEHFIPLYFAFYFLQMQLFGSYYHGFLIISLLFFAYNAYLVYLLSLRLLDNHRFSHEGALTLATIYAANSLQSQLIQWTMVQCIVIAQTFVFIFLLTAYDYLRSGSRIILGIGSLAFCLSLFTFANSFAAVPMAITLICCLLIQKKKELSRAFRSLMLKRASLFIIYTVAILIFSVWLYHQNKAGEGHVFKPETKLAPKVLLRDAQEILTYTYVGAEFGTVLRGTGAFPSNALSAAEYLYPIIYPPRLAQYLRPETFFASIGFICSLLLLIFYIIYRNSFCTGPALWLAGQLIMLSAFILPAIGRWELGLKQALSLRYQHAALFGLIVMLTPLTAICAKYLYERSTTKYMRLVPSFASLLLFIYFAIQSFLVTIPSHAMRNGIRNRTFINQVTQWRALVEKEQMLQNLPYDYNGRGTKYSGLYPTMPPKLTPARSPDDIHNSLMQLDKHLLWSNLVQDFGVVIRKILPIRESKEGDVRKL